MGIYKTTMLTAAALTLASGAAFAGAHGSYPSKPIKIVVGFSAGGGTDTTSRGFASYLHEAESMGGQPAYIVNVPGASGQKGAKQVLGEKADGHTLYMINIGTFIVGELAKGKDKPYSVKNDWVNLGCMSQLVTSIQVHSSNPSKNLAEFIANAKASGKVHTWGTSGATTMHSGIGHLFFDTYGIPHKKVPFKGGVRQQCIQELAIFSLTPTVSLIRKCLSRVAQKHVLRLCLSLWSLCLAATIPLQALKIPSVRWRPPVLSVTQPCLICQPSVSRAWRVLTSQDFSACSHQKVLMTKSKKKLAQRSSMLPASKASSAL